MNVRRLLLLAVIHGVCLATGPSVRAQPVASNQTLQIFNAADHAFVAKVIRQLSPRGTAPVATATSIQFEAQLVMNIKGVLSGTLIVSLPADSATQPDLKPLLQPGYTYLLTSKYSSSNRWHVVSAGPESPLKLVSTDRSLITSELQAVAEKDVAVRQWKTVYAQNLKLAAENSEAAGFLLQELRVSRELGQMENFRTKLGFLDNVRPNPDLVENLLLLIPGSDARFFYGTTINTVTQITREGGNNLQNRLEPLLSHTNPHVRLAAAVTISTCCQPSEAATSIIVNHLEGLTNGEETVQINFGALKGDRKLFISALMKLCDTPNPNANQLGRFASTALANIGPEALPAILEAVKSDKAGLRNNGFWALYVFAGREKADPKTWESIQPGLLPMATQQSTYLYEILNNFPDKIGQLSQAVADQIRSQAENEAQGARRGRNQATDFLPKLPPRLPNNL